MMSLWPFLALLACALLLSGCGSHASPAAGYSESAAIRYAKLSGAAYCAAETLRNWSCGEFCSAFPGVSSAKIFESAAHASVAFAMRLPPKLVLRPRCVLSFRGSTNLQNWLDNLATWRADVSWDGCDGCRTHDGFLSIWLDMRSCVENALEAAGCAAGSEIAVTGHSLGAALAALAALALDAKGWHVVESYDFGRPRVGNGALAAAYDARFRGRSFRITHARDPAPHVPPRLLGFEHTDPEIFYRTNLSRGWAQCNQSDSQTNRLRAAKSNSTVKCSMQFDNLPTLIHVGDHLRYMDMRIVGCPAGEPSDDFPNPPSLDGALVF